MSGEVLDVAAVKGAMRADLSNLADGIGGVVGVTTGKPAMPAILPLPGQVLLRADNGTVGATFLLWAFFHGATDWVALQAVA